MYRFADGRLTSILGPGVSVTIGGDKGSLDTVVGAVPNRNGDVVFQASFSVSPAPSRQGIYLLRRDGRIERILVDGDPAPAGRRFALMETYVDRFGWKHVNPARVPFRLNAEGMAVFAVPVSDSTIPDSVRPLPGGLFSYRRGRLQPLVVSGQFRPDDPSLQFGFFHHRSIEFDINEAGLVAFNPDKQGVFLALNGSIAALALKGGSTGLLDGTEHTIQEFGTFLLNGRRTVAFQASLCCGPYKQGIFLARPGTPPVPNGGFEAAAEAGAPQNWTTWWTNSGTGDVGHYNSGGNDSFDWDSCMRLHTGQGGGAVFVLSDPVEVRPGTAYMLESRMRFFFDPGDRSYFTIVQYDTSGNEVGLDELAGFAGDSYWSWSPMRVLIHTAPDAAFLRYRFGLVSSREKYVDVDALQ